MDKTLRLTLAICAILAGFGVFYHYVIFIPGQEKEKAAAAERRDTERKLIYARCLALARSNYEANWGSACKVVADSRITALRNCLTNNSIVSNPYMGIDYCKGTFGGSDPSPNCTLPKERAETLGVVYKQDQEKCVTEAQLGLQ